MSAWSGYHGISGLVGNGATPNTDQQNAALKTYASLPILSGSGGTWGSVSGGSGGGGVTFIAPYITFSGHVNAYGTGGAGGGSGLGLPDNGGQAGGGGGGGAVVFIGETILATGTYNLGGGGGAGWSYFSGKNQYWRWSQAGGAGLVRFIEYGGRY